MSLKARISEDMVAAMRAKDAPRLSAIRMLVAAIKQKEKDDRLELSEADVLTIVERELKKRRDSISQFQAGGRQDLVDAEAFEVQVLERYLPEQLSDSELGDMIEAAIGETSAQGAKDMGKVMGVLKARVAGRADMGKVSALVKARLTR